MVKTSIGKSSYGLESVHFGLRIKSFGPLVQDSKDVVSITRLAIL